MHIFFIIYIFVKITEPWKLLFLDSRFYLWFSVEFYEGILSTIDFAEGTTRWFYFVWIKYDWLEGVSRWINKSKNNNELT